MEEKEIEKCEECNLPKILCNYLQDIVYEEKATKRNEMAKIFRKEYKELLSKMRGENIW